MKISRRKLLRIHTTDRIWVACACDVCEENFHEWAQICEICESFLPQKFPRYTVASHYVADVTRVVYWDIFASKYFTCNFFASLILLPTKQRK